MDATPALRPLLPTLVETYLARCAIEGKSPRTMQAYRESLARFARCLEEDGAPLDPDRIRPDHVIAYLVRFAALSPDTRHRYFREVRCFCNWLRAAGYTDNDPFRGLRNVRLPRKIVPPLASEEIARLLACCDANTVVGRRDRAIPPDAAGHRRPLRRSGRPGSGGLHAAGAAVARPARQGRQGPGGALRRAMRGGAAAYLADRGTARGPLFVSARNGHLNDGIRLQAGGLRARLRRLGRDAGVRRVHAHRFRHTFATWAIAHDAREIDVQHLLGHGSPEMVRRYSATYGSAQAAERHAAFSPGDGMLRAAG